MISTISLAGTRADRAETLRRLIFGPCSLALHVAVAIGLFCGVAFSGDPLPFVEAMGIHWFTLGVLHRFLSEELSADPVRVPLDPRDAVGMDILHHLSSVHSVTTIDLLEACIRSPRGMFVLRELGIDPVALKKSAGELLHTSDVHDVLTTTLALLPSYNARHIDASHVLAALLRAADAPLHAVLNASDASPDDLDAVVRWEALHERDRRKDAFWAPEQLLLSFGGMGRSWVMGYNTALERLTQDLTHDVRRAKHTTRLHGDVLKNVTTILKRQSRNNALLLGRVGSGRWSLFLHLADECREHELKTGLPLSRFLLLRTQNLLSASGHPDSELLQALEARDGGRFIIVIRDLPLLLKGGDARLLGVLLKLLQSPNVSVVAIADPHDYHAVITQQPGVDSLLERVNIEEPSESDVLPVLMEEYFAIERWGRIAVSYRMLRLILSLSARYIGTTAFPGKAVEVLREVLSTAKANGVPEVTEEMVRGAVSIRAHQDVSQISSGERDVYLHLEENIRHRIIGQKESVHAIAAALKRGKLQLGSRSRPIGTFLLLGPTGVGKTETAKAIAEILFGADDRMIRLDMNEFSEASATERIVGGSASPGFLTRQIQEHPSSLILLDELEKAHPHVLNLFLQILDEGHLIDSDGVKTDFRSSVIVATSNAGALALQKIAATTKDPVELRRSLVEAIVTAGTYSPEFLNRFDEVLVYHPLSADEALQVATVMIDGVVRALEKEKGVTFTLDAEALKAIAAKGYSPEFGARAMRRAIQETLESAIADRFLRNPPRRGERIMMRREDLQGQ